MNIKDTVDIHLAIERLEADKFDHDNVRCLYLSLRFHVEKKSMTRDMGDFFAHSDKDRGPIVQHLASGSVESSHQPGKSVIRMLLPMAISANRIVDDLVAQLNKLKLPSEPIETRRDDLIVCLFALLDSCELTFDGKWGRLRLSSNFSQSREGDDFLSLVFASPGPSFLLLFSSDVLVSDYLEEGKTDDNDFDLHYRSIRKDGHLKVFTIRVEQDTEA